MALAVARTGMAQVGPATIAWVRTGVVVLASELDVGNLSEEDLERAAGFGAVRRQQFLLGRSLVATLVRGLFPDVTDWVVGTRACESCGLPHGPVEVTGVPIVAGVSYAPGMAVAAVAPSRRIARLGVDVEVAHATSAREHDLLHLLGSSNEPVLRRWTRIEAVLKADGRGLLVEPELVQVRRGIGRIPGASSRYHVSDVAGPDGYLISLALLRQPWVGAAAWAAGPRPAMW